MKSIKPGRRQSEWSAAGSVFVAVFGVFWCIVAGTLGAWFMLPFGILFVGFAIGNAVYHHHNATSEDRYSVFDIVEAEEEPDPLNEKYGSRRRDRTDRVSDAVPGTDAKYCPYCGKPLNSDFNFCPECGKKLPD